MQKQIIGLLVSSVILFNGCYSIKESAAKTESNIHLTKRDSVFQAASEIYANDLTNKRESIVESVLMNLVKLKIRIPEKDYSHIILKVKGIESEAENQRLKYIAWLTSQYIESSDCIACDSALYSIYDPDVFYNIVANSLTRYHLSQRLSSVYNKPE